MIPSARAVLLCVVASVVVVSVVRGERMVGGFQKLNRNNAEVQEIVAQAMQKLNDESDSPNWQKADRVVRAKSQIVSGVRYLITVKLRETYCPKSQSPDNCSTYNSVNAGKSLVCELDIWSQPWMDFLRVLKKCPQ
uniref:Cystatin-C-like n=1 Tax=Petromyzon marinus TaxID=7757 RepID=A0AAJ7X2S2_PETMA|nr:cystatin-C-like [Petromyzon marinus]